MASPRRGTPARDLVGRTLGDFVVVSRLDEGGHGVVYRAEQPALGRPAVIKVMQAQQKGKGQAVQRFLREARLASRLDHPYAAHIYAFGAESDGLLWIAMELVRGTPLDRMLAESGPLPLERLVPFFERLCEVVHTAHEQGIVHRDVKPANVMVVARAGRLLPKLLDLGIAKMTDAAAAASAADTTSTGEHVVAGEATAPLDASLTSEGMVVGSPLYMAPEQWRSPQSVDGRTDIYALAIVFYEALTRRRPFSGPNVEAVARAHAELVLPPLGDDLPAALHGALSRGLAKRQEDRPATALDLAAAVRAASGLETEREALPRLDDETRAAVLADGPPPIADAVAALDGARHGYQARDVVREIVAAICHWVGILALACRSRLARRPESELVIALTRRRLEDEEWLELARQLCGPYAESRDLFPMPELVGFVLDGADELRALAGERVGALSEEQLRPLLTRQIGALGRILGALGFLGDYPLAGGWMGARRPGTREPGEPLALSDRFGRPLLRLAPLVQIHAPAPGAPLELFLFAGRGRRGARLLAPPRGFERTDEDFWPWYREHLFVAPDAEGQVAAEASPYRGLAAFSRDDAGGFFGREVESEAFLNRLRVTPLLAVVGASGAGKSSFVEAGVIPGLDATWRVISLRPGATPRAALAAHLPLSPGPTLVVVDQAEELFTLCLDEAERLAFAGALVELARDAVRVVLTLRDDFLIRLTELGPFRDRIAAGLQLLGTPARADLLRILTLPAERAGYRFEEEDLPARMVDAVAGQPGALALLSFTAARLWAERDRHFKQLSRQAYEALGGVGGALAQHAESVRAQLPADEQRLLREAFRALVTAEGTRAVLARAELLEVLGGSAAAARLVDKLVDARLLQSAETESGPTVEVIHETLLAAWPRLVEWRREDAEGARLRDQLRAAARQWDERGRARGLLWRDDALAEHQRWRARYPGQLTAVESAFGDASLAEARRARRNRRLLTGAIFAGLSVALAVALVLRSQATRATARTEADFVKLLQDQGRRLLLEDDVLHAYPYLAAVYDRAGPNPALLYMLGRATRMLDQQVAVLPHGEELVWEALFAPDGRYVMTAGEDARVKVWDRAGRLLRSFDEHDTGVRSIAVSPDGAEAISSDETGRSFQWDVATGRVLAELPGRPGGIAMAWSADGTRVALGAAGGLVLLWDPVARAAFAWLPAHGARVRGLRFIGPSLRLLSAGADGRVHEWDAATGRFAGTLSRGTSSIRSLVVSDDARYVTFAAQDGVVTQVDLVGKTARTVSGQATHITWALTAPTGELLTSGEDGTVVIWEPGDPPEVRTLVKHRAGIFSLALSPDGGRLASAGQDGVAVIWNRTLGRPIAQLVGHSEHVRRVVFDPRGELVATAATDGTARLWRPAEIDRLRELDTGHTGSVAQIALSPDARWIATATWSGELSVHDTDSGAPVARASTRGEPRDLEWAPDSSGLLSVTVLGADVLDPHSLSVKASILERAITAGRFVSPDRVLFGRADGSLDTWGDHGLEPWARVESPVTALSEVTPLGIVVGTASGEVALFDAMGSRRRSFVTGGQVAPVVLDLKRDLVVAGARSGIHFWRLSGETTPAPPIEGHTGQITGIVLLGGGDLMATSSGDGTVRVWDRAAGVHLATMANDRGRVIGLVGPPSGEWFASVGISGHMRFWRVEPQNDFDSVRSRLRCLVPFTLAGERLIRIESPECARP